MEAVGLGHRLEHKPAAEPIGGYSDPRPMVYSGLFPVSQEDFPALRESLEKLQLNDGASAAPPFQQRPPNFRHAIQSDFFGADGVGV